MSKAMTWVAAHQHLIGWALVGIGWFCSSYLGYHFGARKFANEKTELVFEEVSTLIEQSDRVIRELDQSYARKESRDARAAMWQRLFELQRKYDGNRTRLLFLLDKYFGRDTALWVNTTLSGLLSDVYSDQERAEAEGMMNRAYISYFETWSGEWSDDPTSQYDGFKWKMMAKCGMNVKPYIADLVEERKRPRK